MTNVIVFLWCRWGDLNPQGFLHTPLKRARIPIPPHRLIQISLRLHLAESVISLRRTSLSFGLACLLLGRYSIVLAESLPHRQKLLLFNFHKIILTQKKFCYKFYIFIDINFTLFENKM